MVSSLAVPQSQRQQTSGVVPSAANNRPLAFPFASPSSSRSPYQRPDERAIIAPVKNPFLSPNLSTTSSIDDDEGSSSGQDEFHLERYSQDADTYNPHMLRRPKEKPSPLIAHHKQTRQHKPDLNIVTNVSGTQARACGPGIVVEEVAAKKAAKFRPKSIMSARAEHVLEAPASQRFKAVGGPRDLATRRKEKQRMRLDASSNQNPTNAAIRSRSNSNEKPIVIGISIPKDQAEAHNGHLGDESAITLRTPTTPAIVVTPADEAPWHGPTHSSGRRPVSSWYSTMTPGADESPEHDVPPIPTVPAGLAIQSQMSQRLKADLARQRSFDSFASDVEDHSAPRKARRYSTESKERILPSADPGRPMSKGWWNLALSPMLSRAGTLKSIKSRAYDRGSIVPPLPSPNERNRSRSTTLETEPSPETPRRQGLASARASTWSRSTTWEKQKDSKREPSDGDGDELHTSPDETDIRHTQAVVSDPALPSTGLAAEYYHACAVDQLSGTGYFECQNHSCADRLPALQSIYHPRNHVSPVNEDSEQKETVFGAIVMPETPDVTHQRTMSNGTSIQSPEELSPNVREAKPAAVVQARAIGTPPQTSSDRNVVGAKGRPEESTDSIAEPRQSSPAPIPMPEPSRAQPRYPNIAAIVPPEPSAVHGGATVASPGPISPEMQRTMTSQGAVPMSEMTSQPQMMHFYNEHHYPAAERRSERPNLTIYTSEHKPSPQVSQRALPDEKNEEKEEKEKNKKPGILGKLLSCVKKRKANTPPTSNNSLKKRNWLYIIIAVMLALMVIAATVAATQITRKGDGTPTQQQWLNLTGYPPMPTGISTIVRPDTVHSNSQCVEPASLWSCAVPKENQFEIAPNNPDQPNFRFEITFRNGTVPSNMTVPLAKRAHDPFTNDLFTPNPAPPSRADQLFMGNTTDNITEPFDGDQTPFFMTFIPAFPIKPNDPAVTSSDNSTLFRRSHLQPRQNTNVSGAIPAPDVLADGSAAPANLLPVSPQPMSQPVKLYNRGLSTEHYGFYMYYDKSIFLSDVSPVNPNVTASPTGASEDQDGGSLRNQAKLRCTFSQTRFLVQIWTNPVFGGHLLGAINMTVNSALDYTTPGSFPYPTTLTVDRHGGNVNKKAAYCYGMNDLQVIEDDVKAVVVENKGVDGSIVNPSPGLVEINGDDDFDPNAGGIDGGTGGCGCAWQNWN